MGKLLGPEFLTGLDKNPEYTRAGVDRLYCSCMDKIPKNSTSTKDTYYAALTRGVCEIQKTP